METEEDHDQKASNQQVIHINGILFRISPMEWIAVVIVIGMVFSAEIIALCCG